MMHREPVLRPFHCLSTLLHSLSSSLILIFNLSVSHASPSDTIYESYSCQREQAKAVNKDCPGFGDKPTDVFCCPSLFKNEFYCCSTIQIDEIEAERSDREWDAFLRNELPLIILAVIGASAVLLGIVVFVCLHCRRCPLFRIKERKDRFAACSTRTPSSHGSGMTTARARPSSLTAPSILSASSRARPASANLTGGLSGAGGLGTGTAQSHRTAQYGRPRTVEEPKPLLFEAPPPYGIATHYPSTPPAVMTASEIDYTAQNIANSQRLIHE